MRLEARAVGFSRARSLSYNPLPQLKSVNDNSNRGSSLSQANTFVEIPLVKMQDSSQETCDLVPSNTLNIVPSMHPRIRPLLWRR